MFINDCALGTQYSLAIACVCSVDVEEEVEDNGTEFVERRTNTPTPRKTRNYSGKALIYIENHQGVFHLCHHNIHICVFNHAYASNSAIHEFAVH